ncbi:unnamed protein product [Prorocentrum cordatum]|uniref:Aspartyl/asparaginy/proline hydroxylase domain-containing protein n=1 Tax=Prorocentrum cordatum TaxID=2364126 RepID=A0ABN9WAV0_9DINO|nr:unnamed protein product [Polarella glacialis]
MAGAGLGQGALAAWRRAVDLDPGCAEGWLALGREAARASAASQERVAPPWVVEQLGARGQAESGLGGAAEARSALRAALAARPTWAKAHAMLALVCQAWAPRNESCVLRHAAAALSRDAQSEPALVALAAAKADALPLANSCSGSCSAAEWAAGAGRLTVQRRVLEREVAALLRRAVAAAPERAELRAALAAQLGGSDEALELLRSAVDLAPSSRLIVGFAMKELRYHRRPRERGEMLQAALGRRLWRLPFHRPLVYWPSFAAVSSQPQLEILRLALGEFRSRLPEIRKELMESFNSRLELDGAFAGLDGFTPCPTRSRCSEETPGLLPARTRYAGRWLELQIYDERLGQWRERGCQAGLSQSTCDGLAAIARLGLRPLQASVSAVFGPATYIQPHEQLYDMYRMHCVLALPAGAQSVLQLGDNSSIVHGAQGGGRECFWFNEAVEHELSFSAGPGLVRTVLIVDVIPPELLRAGAPLVEERPFSASHLARAYM